MHRWIAFFDFDGTITSEETFYGSMLRLNPQALEKERRALVSGEVRLREGLLRIFSGTPSEKYPLIEEYIKGVPFRDGFRELLVYLKSHNIPAVVISGGIKQLIDMALVPYRELIMDVYSVHLDLSGEHMRLVSEYDDGDELMSKTTVMDRYAYENAICIGDGVTDVRMAKKSTIVFARDDLRAICDKEQLPYKTWDDFFDILKVLKGMEGAL